MVVTTGDNYGGSRWANSEKSGELYATVAPNFTAATLSQLENMLMEIALIIYPNSIKSKHQIACQKQANENALPFTLKTYNEFDRIIFKLKPLKNAGSSSCFFFCKKNSILISKHLFQPTES
jgi:hypothetical protein